MTNEWQEYQNIYAYAHVRVCVYVYVCVRVFTTPNIYSEQVAISFYQFAQLCNNRVKIIGLGLFVFYCPSTIVGGACGVMVIVVRNGHGETSSNPGRDWLHIALKPMGKVWIQLFSLQLWGNSRTE